MTIRNVQQVHKAYEVSEGAGVTVFRTIGTPAVRNLDPFLMLDFFCSDDPDDYIAGFPDHPHRGFVTFTYMIDGHMQHRDSMGNEGDLRSGGAQWMKAASGVIHSEMPKQSNGLMRGFQLWINLPAREKMSAPGYQEFSPEAIPEVEQDGIKVRVLMGQYQGVAAPIKDDTTQVHYLDVSLAAQQTFEHSLPAELRGFIYMLEGSAQVGDDSVAENRFAILGDGESLRVTTTDRSARFIVVAGRPIGEPVVQYGPFVMNSEEEIHQAMRDYRDGKLVQQKAAVVGA